MQRPGSTPAPTTRTICATSCRRPPIIPSLLLALLSACAGGADPPPPSPVALEIAIPDGRVLDSFAVSPDGRWLVYAAETRLDRRRRLFVRELRAEVTSDRELADAVGARNPFFSPDGSSVAYFYQSAVWRVAIRDGVVHRICDAPFESAGGAWTSDGRIVFAPRGGLGLTAVPATGGAATSLTSLNLKEGEVEHGWPHALPGGGMLFTVAQRDRDPHLEVLGSDGQRTRLRVPIVGQGHYLDSGHIVYGYLGNLMAVPFDAAESALRGVPVLAERGLQSSGAYGLLGRMGIAAARVGTLIWVRAGPEDATSEIVRVEGDGSFRPIGAPAAIYQTPRLTPDGRRLAVAVRDVLTREIRVLDTARPDRVLWMIRGGDNQSPAWMDNRRLTFGSNREGRHRIYVATATREPTPLFDVDVASVRNPGSWVRARTLLALFEIDPIRRRDVLVYRVGESIAPAAATPANERSPSLSPDGRWLAYVSDATGRDEVFIKPLDESLEAMQLTSRGATEPLWTRDGLYYREGDKMMLATFPSGPPGTLREVFEGQFEHDPGSNLPAYDVDGRGSFIMLRSTRLPREFRVVQNWRLRTEKTENRELRTIVSKVLLARSGCT